MSITRKSVRYRAGCTGAEVDATFLQVSSRSVRQHRKGYVLADRTA
jgi:hypothetical protein